MKKLTTLLIALSTLTSAFAAEIYSKNDSATTFIKVMELKPGQYSFASCDIIDRESCSMIGEKNYYTKNEVKKAILKLGVRGVHRVSSNITLIAGATVGGVALGASLIIVGAFAGGNQTFVRVSLASMLGLPAAGVALSTTKIMTPRYPTQLVRALNDIIEDGTEETTVRVKKMDYLAKLLGKVLD